MTSTAIASWLPPSEVAIRPRILGTIAALNAADGWSVLGFLKSPHLALDGLTPRAAIERTLGERVAAVAMAEAR